MTVPTPFQRLSDKGLPYPRLDDHVATQEMAELVETTDAYVNSQWATDIGQNQGLSLKYAYKGGVVFIGGVFSRIVDGTLIMTASATNYVERDANGVVTVNQVGFSTDKLPMAKVTTNASLITLVEDWRVMETPVAVSAASIENEALMRFVAG